MSRNRLEERIYKRKPPFREIKDSFLIYCQGKNTEPEYFRLFRLSSAHTKILNIKGGDSLKFVEEVVKDKNKRINKYDQYWLVFDKDDTIDSKFNQSIKLGQENGMKIAYSIQAFEFWYILHFENITGKLSRKEYSDKLKKYLSTPYSKEKKDIPKILNLINPNCNIAIARAKNIYVSFEPHNNPASEESSTTVFKLVEALIKFI